MKVINNQWQLSAAICLLIITLLTLLPLAAQKLAVIVSSWAYSTDLSLKRVSASVPFTFLYIQYDYCECAWVCVRVCAGIMDGQRVRVPGNIHADPCFLFTYTLPLPAHSRQQKHYFTSVESRIHWGIHTANTHNPYSIILLQEKKILWPILYYSHTKRQKIYCS